MDTLVIALGLNDQHQWEEITTFDGTDVLAMHAVIQHALENYERFELRCTEGELLLEYPSVH